MLKSTQSRRDTRPITLLREIYRAYQAVTAADAANIGGFDLQPTEFDVIATLGNTQGLRMCDLATRMLTSPPNVTRVTKKLEARGLLTRVRSATSEREVIARLTPAGAALFEVAYPTVCDAVERYFDARLGVRDQLALTKLLRRLRDPA